MLKKNFSIALCILSLIVLFTSCASTPVTINFSKETSNFLHTAEKKSNYEGEDEYFIRTWLALGPFEYDGEKFGGEWGGQKAADKEFVKNEAKLTPEENAEVDGKKWAKLESESGMIDLGDLYEDIDYAAAYLGAYIYVPEAGDNYTIHTGSDDYIKIYINEKLVFTYNEKRRAAVIDEDEKSGITLKKGWNKIVVKIVDVVLGWQFALRISGPDDKPFKVIPK